MSMAEVSDKIEDIKETLDYLKDKRSNALNDQEKNEYTKRIGMVKKNLHDFTRRYQDRLPKETKVEEPKPMKIYKPTLKAKLRAIEEKAAKLLEQATTDEERRSIKERLEAVQLRFKYSY